MTLFRDFTGLRNVHFVGIGGAGMSGIAEVLLDYNLEVSGCDQSRGETVEHLESLGVAVAAAHGAGHLDGVELVVRSSAVAADHPEIADRMEILGGLL